MDWNLKDGLLALCDAYAKAKNLSHWRVASLAHGNGQFFKRLRDGKTPKGRDVTVSEGVAIRVRQWFSDNWPSDLDWPQNVPRPHASDQAEAAS